MLLQDLMPHSCLVYFPLLWLSAFSYFVSIHWQLAGKKMCWIGEKKIIDDDYMYIAKTISSISTIDYDNIW